MSGSTPVTSRDQGAVQEILTELPLLILALKLVTDDGGPEMKTGFIAKQVIQIPIYLELSL